MMPEFRLTQKFEEVMSSMISGVKFLHQRLWIWCTMYPLVTGFGSKEVMWKLIQQAWWDASQPDVYKSKEGKLHSYAESACDEKVGRLSKPRIIALIVNIDPIKKMDVGQVLEGFLYSRLDVENDGSSQLQVMDSI